MIASISAVVVNLILNITLHPHFGYRVLAAGTAAAAIVNFAILYVMFGRAVTRLPHAHLLGYLARVGVAATIMGAAVWASYRGAVDWLGTAGLTARLLGALGPITAGALVYALACRALRIEELGSLSRRLSRRLR
jgi:putative peptidoglycan lipid II flippase